MCGRTARTVRWGAGGNRHQSTQRRAAPGASRLPDRHPTTGRGCTFEEPLLRRTLNAALLDAGSAYLTLYTSTPSDHASVFRALASAARDASKGVWAADATREFQLVNQDSIGPEGQLILPKLFRRCSDYLKARDAGYRGNLDDWLIDVSTSGRRPEDDKLIIGGRTEVRLSAVLQQRNDRIRFPVDLLDLVFVEK